MDSLDDLDINLEVAGTASHGQLELPMLEAVVEARRHDALISGALEGEADLFACGL